MLKLSQLGLSTELNNKISAAGLITPAQLQALCFEEALRPGAFRHVADLSATETDQVFLALECHDLRTHLEPVELFHIAVFPTQLQSLCLSYAERPFPKPNLPRFITTLNSLTYPRQGSFLKRFHGLGPDGKPQTIPEIAHSTGLTTTDVRRELGRARHWLRNPQCSHLWLLRYTRENLLIESLRAMRQYTATYQAAEILGLSEASDQIEGWIGDFYEPTPEDYASDLYHWAETVKTAENLAPNFPTWVVQALGLRAPNPEENPKEAED